MPVETDGGWYLVAKISIRKFRPARRPRASGDPEEAMSRLLIGDVTSPRTIGSIAYYTRESAKLRLLERT
jgi:hypothetical protein